MVVKKYAAVTIKATFYQPQDRTPDKSIEEIKKGIKALGGKDVNIVGNKLTNEIKEENE
jgi:hypothetical protein